MGIDSKSLNAAMVSGQGAQSNAVANNKSTPVKKSSSSTDSRSTAVPNNTNAQRIINDMNSNSAVIAAATVTSSGPKFNPYLFPYMPQQMPMPSASAPSAPKIASTNSRGRGDDGGGEGGGGPGSGPNVDEGFKGAVPPSNKGKGNSPFEDKSVGDKKTEEGKEKPETPKAKEETKSTPETKTPEVNTTTNEQRRTTSLSIGFDGEFA